MKAKNPSHRSALVVLFLLMVVSFPVAGAGEDKPTQSRYGYHCVHTEARDRQAGLQQEATPVPEAITPVPEEVPGGAVDAGGGEQESQSDEAPPAPSPGKVESPPIEAEPEAGEATATVEQVEEGNDEQGEGERTEAKTRTRAEKRAIRKSSPPTGRNALGISIGLASGTGISYRRYVTNFLALRVDGGIVASTEAALYSIGLTVQEDVLRTFYYRLYTLQSVAVSGGPNRVLTAPGAGIGFEYNFDTMRRGVSVRGEWVLTPLFVSGTSSPPLFTFLPQFGVAFVF